MKEMSVENKKVTVLGAGKSGLAAAKLLEKNGAGVFVSDSRSRDKVGDAADRLDALHIGAEFGGHSNRVFDCDFCVISPGISIDSREARAFKERNIPVFSELEAASWFCRGRIAAVTGSNGKSTVTSLIGEIFKHAGLETAVAGNIGTPFSAVAESVPPEGYAVLEVSSFQLEAVKYLKPSIGVFLNLTPDHLNRHGTMETYGMLKAALFANQTDEDVAVFWGDDPVVPGLLAGCPSRKVVFGIAPMPERQGCVKDGVIHCMVNGRDINVVEISRLRIKGEHNVLNAVAASLAALHAGVEPRILEEALCTFTGLAHRMEYAGTVNGVDFCNDSKATNIDAVVYALKSYTEPVVLIAGGRDKDSDFSLLRQAVQDHVRKIIVIGEASQKIAGALSAYVPVEKADSLEQAVHIAGEAAAPGETVLLSPACASFDMFDSFEHRGDEFKRIVGEMHP